MRSLLFLFAIALIIFWVIGFFVYSAGAIIHLLLVVAGITLLARTIRGNKREIR